MSLRQAAVAATAVLFTTSHAFPAGGAAAAANEGTALVHDWCTAKRAGAKGGDCSLCHKAATAPPEDVAPVCTGCHTPFRGNKHPGLRHPVSAPRDPMRTDRKFDCISCHDPHCPAPLGTLTPEERREWCRGCHARK